MTIAVKAGYEVAMLTDNTALTVASLRHHIKVINAALCRQGVKPYDRVFVRIAGETNLLAVLWALRERKITAVPISPEMKDIDMAALAATYTITHILTEEGWAGAAFPLAVIAVDTILQDSAPKMCSGSCSDLQSPDHTNYIFLNEEAPTQPGESVDETALHHFFDQLDAAITPAAGDVLLLSRCIPYARFVMECMWACVRGIPIVVASLQELDTCGRYLNVRDHFNMEFGLFHFGSYIESGVDNKYHSLFETVQFADRNGFVSAWTPERHFNEFGGLFPNPAVISAALAVATKQVQLRSGSLVSPLHHPVRIAEDWALVDNLSNGRVAISFASGWQCDDFVFAPQHYEERHNYMLEQIDVVRRLWRGEQLSFNNGLHKEIDIAIYPKPVQAELPFWITVSGRTETFADAGKIGANILTHLLWQDIDHLVEKIAVYRRSLQEHGFAPGSRKVSVMVHTYLGEDNEVVKEKVRKPLKEYIKASTQLIQAMAKSNREDAKGIVGRYGDVNTAIPDHLMEEMVEIAFNRFFDQAALLGTIDKARELVRRLRSYDIDEIACLIDFGLPHADIMKGLEYLRQLKDVYTHAAVLKDPVTITHCSEKTYQQLSATTSAGDFLQSQRKILVETGLVNPVSDDRKNVVYVSVKEGLTHVGNDPVVLQQASNSEQLFNSTLSAEF